MKLALIPPGEFDMGSPKELLERDSRANMGDGWFMERLPCKGVCHRVRITKPYWLGVTDVTQEEYQRLMGVNPSSHQGDPKMPVENISWEGALEFCRRLSDMPGEKVAKRQYGLPTEAQWEYACRAGNEGPRFFSPQAGPLPAGWEEKMLGEYAWFKANAGGRTHPVGQKRASAWGLYDMYGNVWQWCKDWYDKDYYANSPTDDPAGPPRGREHVGRGGGYNCAPIGCRSASRVYVGACFILGFRVSVALADQPASLEATADQGPSLPRIDFGKWFPLLTSPDELIGWNKIDDHIRYSNSTLETQGGTIGYPVIAKDVSLRVKAKNRSGPVALSLRRSDQGRYAAWFDGPHHFGIGKFAGSKWIDLIKTAEPPRSGDNLTEVGFSAVGDTLTLFLDGRPMLQTRDSSYTQGTASVGGAGTNLFTDVEMFLPTQASLVADNRKPPEKTAEPGKR